MKSITKLMVVAMLLVAALVVAPVAARTITADGVNIFIGEDRVALDVTPGTGLFDGANRLVHYTGTVGSSSIDKTLSVDSATGAVEELQKGIPTGSYYAMGGALAAPPGGPYVNIYNPEATLDIMLNSSPKDSVNGKTITRDTWLDFKFYSNVDFGGLDARAVVELTLPGGGVVTTYNGTFLNFDANGQTQVKDVHFGPKAEAGTYTAIAKWNRSTDFFGKDFDSKPVTFEVLTKPLTLTANKDSVVRGNSFTVTITGESRKEYILSVKDGDTNTPLIAPGQTAVPDYGILGEEDWNRTVKTNAGGTATIQFNTSADAPKTDTKTFTVKVKDPVPPGNDDEIKVKVEAGSVTITTSGTGTYYIGEEITLSGTCTEGNRVYFFMTGPNLDADGVNLTELEKVDPTDSKTFDYADVEADDTWSYKWNTADIKMAIDAGGYTIYAVSDFVNKKELSKAKYATASINLRTGFLTATTSGTSVAKGDKLTISGIAQGNPTNVYVWIFGKNYYGAPSKLDVRSASVESDGGFEVKLKSSDTESLAAGQYFVVVQHPMGVSISASPDKTAGSIVWNSTNGTIEGAGISSVKLTGLQAPAAASALINILDSPNIPDTYVKLTFFVEEPIITIDPISTKEAGSKFTITGTTNLAVGGTLNIEVTSAAFQPGSKTEATGFSSAAGTTVIEKGDGANKWSFEVDAAGFKPDQYIVNVESIDAGTTTTANFDMVEATEEPTTPVGEVTTPPAGETTTPPAAETTTEPAPTPGFGALVALAGLGAVAFLVLRRK